MTEVGVARLRYALIELRPSRFANGGVDYAAWCKRADFWAVNNG